MASFDKITNNISQGLQTAGQVVSLIQNVKQAKDAQKNGGSIPLQQQATDTQATAAANAAQASATGGSTTNLNIGLSKKTLIIGGACVAGLLLVVLLARR